MAKKNKEMSCRIKDNCSDYNFFKKDMNLNEIFHNYTSEMDNFSLEVDDGILHYNKWLTDKIKDYIENADSEIYFLFEPYKSFSKMSILFGLNGNYLREQRYSKNANNVIAKSTLNEMCFNFEEKIERWTNSYPQFTNLLLNIQSDIIDIINEYEKKFNPKPVPKYQMYRYHPNFKRTYFSEISTLEQAYWLGFLFADAYIGLEHKNSGDYYRMGIGLSEKDKDIIKDFCKAVGLNPEHIRTKMALCSYTNKKTLISRIRWGDQEFAKDLMKLGMKYEYDEKKKRRVKHPQLFILKSRVLMLAFLLGFYDGDGSLGLYTDKKGKETIFPTIISTNKDFLYQIKKYFNINYELYSRKSEKYDFKKKEIVITNSFQLYLGTKLFLEMLKSYRHSLKRKRYSIEIIEKYDISSVRAWLIENLPKNNLQQMASVLSSHIIGKKLGIDGRTIISYAESELGFSPFRSHGHYTKINNTIRWHGKNSQFYDDVNYWFVYLSKLGTYIE